MSIEFSYEMAKKLMRSMDKHQIGEQGQKFQELMMMYECAIKEVRTKIEVLNEEFKITRMCNPIDNIESRIKKPISIFEKAQRKGYAMNFSSIMENMNDIAGIRVICPFIEDIYTVAGMITNQDDLRVVSVKDYIKNPKPNGYRSFHLVVEVPIFLSTGKYPIKVEVQLRTIAMDFWASLEHQIHYKKFDGAVTPEEQIVVNELKECADTIYATDRKMENIRLKLEKLNERDNRIK